MVSAYADDINVIVRDERDVVIIIIIIIIHSIYIAPFNDPRTHTRVKRQKGGDRG